VQKKKDGGVAYQKWASSAQRLVHHRTIRWQTGSARWSRRTAVLKRLSAGRRIRPVSRRTPGEVSGPAGPSARASGLEAGRAKLTADPQLGLPPTARFPPTYKYPFVQLGLGQNFTNHCSSLKLSPTPITKTPNSIDLPF
jgi:hypothetical protein